MKKLILSIIVIIAAISFAAAQGNLQRHHATLKSTASTFTEFSDNFESGITGWTTTSTWGLSTTKAYSPTHSLSESPSGNYANNLTSYCTMASGIDLSGKMSAEVSFWAQYKIEAGFDYMYVDVSNDDFTTFTNLAIFDGELTTWTQFTYSLGGYVGPGFTNVKVRFRFISDQGFTMDGMYIDDFLITSSDEDHSPPLVLTTPPEFYEGSLGEYVVEAEIIDISGLASALCNYNVDGAAQTPVEGVNTGGNHYTFTIPAQPAGSGVDYTLEITDASTFSNTTTMPVASYIAGEYYKYDNGVVDYFVQFFASEGASVVFSLNGPTHITTALIRNYTDVDHLNGPMTFHIWAPDQGLTGPGADLITPFEVTPEASLSNTSPMTRIDLRPYMATGLNNLTGDVFMGFTVPDDTVNITETSTVSAGRTFIFDGTEWGAVSADFHFRLITTGSGVSVPELSSNEFSISPNPMSHYTLISTSSEIQHPRVEIYTLDGRRVEVRQYASGNKIQLTRNQLQTGLYLLRMFDGNKLIGQQKLSVQ